MLSRDRLGGATGDGLQSGQPPGGEMAARGTKTGATLAFLTVVDDSQHGACGGLLVLNAAGRPLEFHCTTPLKPNRAQEILYGPTLRPYLYGERIGATLVAGATAPLDLLCVDLPEALTVRPHVQPPTVLVELPAAADGAGRPPTLRIDRPHAPAAPRHWFEANGHRLAV